VFLWWKCNLESEWFFSTNFTAICCCVLGEHVLLQMIVNHLFFLCSPVANASQTETRLWPSGRGQLCQSTIWICASSWKLCPSLLSKNEAYIATEKRLSFYFWSKVFIIKLSSIPWVSKTFLECSLHNKCTLTFL